MIASTTGRIGIAGRLAGFVTVLLVVSWAVPEVRSELILAENGRTEYVIALPADAILSERHAAEELSRFLNEATGAVFEITVADRKTDRPRLFVGAGPEAETLAGADRLHELGPDEYVIVSHGRDLVLAGGRPRGTLYAVYGFLEDVVGCRWWTANASHVPNHTRLAVPDLDIRGSPWFEYREPYFPDALDPDWAARNRVFGLLSNLDERRGGRKMLADTFTHSFYRLAPPQEFFASHPQWYSERQGKRFWEEGQLCLTNESLKRHVIARVLEHLRAQPDAELVCVSQNDREGRCECSSCMALERDEQSPAGPVLHFVNAVAEAVEAEFPEVAVSTLAYRYTRRPPLHVRPRHNVIIRLCSIECSHTHRYDDPVNQAFARDLEGWSRICNRIYIWDYVIDFRNTLQPFPNLHVLGPNMRQFAQAGAQGVFSQGYGSDRGGEFAELRAWVLAKLMWDPQLDADALIREFVEGYYGPAASSLLAYLQLIQEALEHSGVLLGHDFPVRKPHLSLSDLAQAERLFNEAEKQAAGQPEFLQRVQAARAPLRATWTARWNELQQTAHDQGATWPGPANYTANAQAVIEVAEREGWNTLTVKAFREQYVAVQRREAVKPPGFEHLAGWQYVDFQDHDFWLAEASRQSDPPASDGVAALALPVSRFRENAAVLSGLLAVAGIGALFGALAGARAAQTGTIAVIGVAVLSWPTGALIAPWLAGTQFHQELSSAAGQGIASGALLMLAVVWTVVAATLWRTPQPETSGGIHPQRRSNRVKGLAYGTLLGALLAVSGLSAIYNLGAAMECSKGALAVPPSQRHFEPERGATWQILARTMRSLDVSLAGPWLRHACPIDPVVHERSWAVSQHLFPFFPDQAARYRCFAAVRAQDASESSPSFEAGLYDEQGRGELAGKVFPSGSVSTEEYQLLDLGEYPLSNSMRLWISPPRGAGLWVDRFFVIASNAAGTPIEVASQQPKTP